MSANTVDRLHLAVLDGHLMDDATLARLVPECRSLTSFTTGGDGAGLEQRWAVIAPGTELIDGGQVADLREAMVECAKRRIVVISTGVPADPASFVAHALQGAAAMTEFDVPGVAVHVMRPVERPGSVAWLTDTGELSGYGVLFAVGYAHLHSTSVELIEPSSGLGRPRTAEALDDALAFAEAAGVPVVRHTDPSPFARVLRDEHCMVVHPVLDAPKGFNLLHPGELSRKAVASGNPAVVVELLEKFPGDVVAVFDGVHLLQGSIPAARIAAGVALGVVAAAGIGTMVASPAMASTVSQSAQSGVVASVSGQNGMGHPGIAHVQNTLDHAVTVTLTVTWRATSSQGNGGHGGNHPDQYTEVSNVVLQPGQSLSVTIPRPSGDGHGSYHPIQVDPQVTSHHQVVGETSVTVEPARGPGALVDEKDPTTMLQPNAPQQQVPPPITQETPTPMAVPTLQAQPMLVPPDPVKTPPPITQETPTPMAVPTLQPTLEPPVIQQVPPPITQETPTPMAVPTLQPTLEPPVIQQVPPPITQETPTPMAVPTLQPTLEPPVIQQVPPPITQETPTPMAVPTLQAQPMLVPPDPVKTPPPITQETPTLMAVPTLQAQPMLVPPDPVKTPPPITQETPTPMAVPTLQAPSMSRPPLQATPTDVVTESVPTVVAGGVVTPDVPVEVGSSVVTPGVTTEAPTTEGALTVSVTTRPGDVGGPTSTTQQAGTPHHVTHHASHRGHVTSTAVDGDHAPAGELAHTGGNTAILAIVAGSLLAAGAGLAVAGRMGKDDPDTGATDG